VDAGFERWRAKEAQFPPARWKLEGGGIFQLTLTHSMAEYEKLPEEQIVIYEP